MAEWEASDEAYLKFRKVLDDDGNAVHFSTKKGSDMQRTFVETFSAVTRQKLSKAPPRLLEHFSPDFGVGCRRITPGPGYLEALCEANVELITDDIASINPRGLVVTTAADGRQRQIDADVLVCATGFTTTSIPPFPVVGERGATLADRFTPFPQTYLSLAVDGFPNYFMMLGPNSGIGAGSLNPIIEAEGDYVVKCIRKLQREDYLCMAPKRARVEDFSEYVGDYFRGTVYMDDCRSWYKTGGEDGTGGGEGNPRVSGLWPGSLLHLLEALRAPRWEDFDFVAGHRNRLRWLGDGGSVCLTGGGDPSWYLNADVVDVPPCRTPESDARYRARPFSH